MPTRLRSTQSHAFLLLAAFPCIAFAQDTPVINSFLATGGLTWTNVLAGHHYAIQQRQSFLQPWTNFGTSLDNVPATGGVMRVTVPISGSQKFFRVADLGSCCTNSGGPSYTSATNLGQGCGDDVLTMLTSTGCGGGWFRTRVNECSSSVFTSRDLWVTITLTSPPGTDYDLVFYGPNGTIIQATPPESQNKSVIYTVSDTPGVDDSFDVILNVVPRVAWSCTNWTLQVQFGGH